MCRCGRKRSNLADPRWLSLRRPSHKADPWPASGNTDLNSVVAILELIRIVPKLFGHTVGFMLNICFPFGSLKYWYVLGRECLCDQPQIKALGGESLMSFFGRQQFVCVVTIQCWKNYACPVGLHWRRTPRSSCSVSSGLRFMGLFPLLMFFGSLSR